MPLVLPNRRRTTRKLTSDEMKKMRDKDHKMVKGLFRCFEPRGGSMTFCFKKYAGDDVLIYTMEDGKKYDVPLMVAKHLNQKCWYPKHKHLMDADGNTITDPGDKIHRCSFESLEFNDMLLEEEANDNAG